MNHNQDKNTEKLALVIIRVTRKNTKTVLCKVYIIIEGINMQSNLAIHKIFQRISNDTS